MKKTKLKVDDYLHLRDPRGKIKIGRRIITISWLEEDATVIEPIKRMHGGHQIIGGPGFSVI